MKFASWKRIRLQVAIGLLLCLIFAVTASISDGIMPTMPEPPEKPVYWKLASIEQEPFSTPSGGYTVDVESSGLDIDLSDGLMAETLLASEAAPVPIVHLTIANGERRMEHVYTWTPPPIYLAKNESYELALSGYALASPGSSAPSSVMTLNFQGEAQLRVSAEGYGQHPTEGSYVFSTAQGVFDNGTFVISFTLRDVNNMFRMRTAYTYEQIQGLKPEPTPIPGFVAEDVPENLPPAFYTPVPGKEGLYQIITAPDQFRAYGVMNGSKPMFFPADENGNVKMNEKPATAAGDFANYVEGFYQEVPAALPAHYRVIQNGVYGFTAKNGETIFRAHGRVDGQEPAFYPYSGLGTINLDDGPVDTQADFETYIEGFGPALPQSEFPNYSVLGPGLYSFTGRDGVVRYRAYGRLDGAEPQYYEADMNGTPVQDAQPILPEDDFVAYIKGFDPVEPEDIPPFYQEMTPGLFAVLDQQGTPIFRAYGVKDGEPPAFYPADAGGVVPEDAESVAPTQDYDTYIAGFVPGQAANPPAFYGDTDTDSLYVFTDKNGDKNYRVYGALNRSEPAYYPANELGEVALNALPVDPASDLKSLPAPMFAARAAESVPAHYQILDESQGLYSFEDREGNVQRRVYGAFGADMPYFYPADGLGRPLEGTLPVDPMQDFADYFEGFTPMTAEPVPPQYTPVDGEGLYAYVVPGDTLYRVYGSKDRGEPMFFRADEAGNPLEPTNPDDDILLIPTPYITVVITPPPASGAKGPIERIIPATPAPTFYTRDVRQPSGATTTPDLIGRKVAPTPTATVFTRDVLPVATPVATSNPIERSVTPTPAATSFATDIVPAVTPNATPTETIAREVPAATVTPTDTIAPKETETEAPATTAYAALVGTPGPTGEVTTQAISHAVADPNGGTEPATADPAVQTDAPATDAPTDTATEAPTEEPPKPTLEATEEEITQAQPTDSGEAASPEPTVTEANGNISWAVIAATLGGVLLVGGYAYYYFLRRKK